MSPAGTRMGMLDMKVAELTVDPITDLPLVILSDASGKEAVPIWIGVGEAPAIAAQLRNVGMQRPLAHDLMKSILTECGLRVSRIEVRDIKGSTYYASILLERQGELIELDARPSDALALALRTDAPILVARRVIEKSRRLGLAPLPPKAAARQGKPPQSSPRQEVLPPDLLGLLRDEDFGKWKM